MWNTRGACFAERQNKLRRICAKKKIEIFGALETKTGKDEFKEASEKWGEEWSIIRNGEGDGKGSIWVGWRTNQWSTTVVRAHKQFVHARMVNSGGYTFDLTVVYDEGTIAKRRLLWSGIEAIRYSSNETDWLMIGDFNEIWHPSERQGRGVYDRTRPDEFESAIGGSTEIEAIGGTYTWANGTGSQHTRSKLDRALGNTHWIARWPKCAQC